MFRRALIGLVTAGAVLSGGVTVTGTAYADDIRTAAVTITYDASRAEEFAGAVDQGVAVWNESLENVQIVPADGGHADITIVADDGWPRAELGPVRPGGDVTVWMGRQAVAEGYDVVRIAAHELGHSLGLPDMKPGPCSSLMSGSSAGTECTNRYPDAAEIAAAEANYASAGSTPRTDTTIIAWND